MYHILCRGFGKTSNHPGGLAPLQPRFGALRLLAFPKTKIAFEREEISGKYDGAADGDWKNCVRSEGAYFEGDWGIIVLCTMFLVSSSINVSFSYCMVGYLLDRYLHMPGLHCLCICIYLNIFIYILCQILRCLSHFTFINPKINIFVHKSLEPCSFITLQYVWQSGITDFKINEHWSSW